MRTTIDLPDDLLRKVKATAALRGIKLKDLITTFIERGLGLEDVVEPRPAKRPLPKGIRKAIGDSIPAFTNAEVEAILIDEDISRAG